MQLFANGVSGSDPVRQAMKPLHPITDVIGGHVYQAAVSSTRPPTDYTARIVLPGDEASVPLEDARILWQR